MQPIALRTRHQTKQTNEDLMRRYVEWKKSQRLSTPERDPAVLDSVAIDVEEEEAESSSNRRVPRRNASESSRLLLISSSSDSDEEEEEESSDSLEENSDPDEEEEVEVKSDAKIQSLKSNGDQSSDSEEETSDSDEEEEVKVKSGAKTEPLKAKDSRIFIIDVSSDSEEEEVLELQSGAKVESLKSKDSPTIDDGDRVFDQDDDDGGREIGAKMCPEKHTGDGEEKKVRKRPFTGVNGSEEEAGDQSHPKKKLFRDHEENEGEDLGVARESPKAVTGRDRKRPSTVDDGVVEKPEPSPPKTENTTASSDSDEGDPEGLEMLEEETEVESMYNMMGFYLACDETDDENDAADAFAHTGDCEESGAGKVAPKKFKDRKRPFTGVNGSEEEAGDQSHPKKKLFRDHEENEGEDLGVARESPKVVPGRDRKRPSTALSIHRVLFNSIMDVDDGVVEKPELSPPEANDTTASSDSDEGDPEGLEMPEEETEVDSMYKMMGFYLACEENDYENEAADAFAEEEEAELDAKKSRKQLCNEGKHHFILDEEIGILCKYCGFVQEEIRHVLPSFNENPFGYSGGNRYSMYDRRDGGDRPWIDDLDSQYNYQDDPDFDPSGTVWELIPGIRKSLLPHQREAFEVIWKNVAGGTKLDELVGDDITEGGGCLISHAPGTGKTRLAIAFLETYMKFYKNSRPVILAPASILLTWKKEFEKWKVDIPFQSLIEEDLSKDEAALAVSLGINLNRQVDRTTKRLVKLLFWKKHDSVLAISYTLFSQLASGGDGKKKASSSRRLNETDMFREMLLDRPGLLILDEGHMPRNERSCMFKVLSEVKTKRRFILSGTPFQNNFRELYNILGLVMPRICEKNPFNKRVEKGDEEKIRKLKSEIEPFFHCYKGGIVAKMVPGLNDSLVFLEPSELQKKLFRKVDMNPPRSHFESDVSNALISVHPRLFGLKEGSHDFTEELKSGKWNIADGAKLRFLLRLIELSLPLGEKVLVFSEFLHPLNLVKVLLESSDHFGWQEGREILVMSGQQDMNTRKRNMDIFNKPGSEAKVMLASIKATSEGIELTGASRVVLFSVLWNPAVERQAISRAYRLGQGRVVHVYRLRMTEHDSYRHSSQTHKNKCANYVFSSRNRKKGDAPGSSKPASEDMVLDQLLQENLAKEATQCDAS